MPSSQADREGCLRALAHVYDEAMGAALNGNLDRTAALLDESEALLARLTAMPEAAPSTGAAQIDAEAARARLAAVLGEAQHFILGEQARVRTGRKLLQRYVDTTVGLGGNVESKA
jgi:hypothetical protein